ncbi:FtsX-like permease family protein [Rhodanobacter sp. C06]|uniref:ABC transporter permease n=1 Tax=Rhodanobacter sp. C06 TaxID=1945854 RepID=UPI000985FF66|nr:FtsX-like permease family protein [Rhodanobacter sp. C06]
MQLRPILSTLRHHRLTAMLLTLQVALTCAIVCNVAFMIASRIADVSMPTGIAESELSTIQSTGTDLHQNAQALHDTDLAALRAIPGVESVVAVSSALPLNRNDSFGPACPSRQVFEQAMRTSSLFKGGDCPLSSFYDGTPGLLNTLGLQLVAGRDFLPGEYTAENNPHVAIISRALADKLYPGQDALGKVMILGGNALQVSGVVATLARPELHGMGDGYASVIMPQLPDSTSEIYVLRSAPSDREHILKAAEAVLFKVDPTRVIDPDQVQTYSQIRDAYFQRDTTMIGLLIASALGLLFVTALGIAGLANFWVQQRTRSIGIRRAIGATRGDILRYFQTENLLIVTVGIVLGVLLAVLMNLLLMTHYELPRLPLWYLPIGAAVLWALGQLSVLSPALRAAQVPPVVATRSV